MTTKTQTKTLPLSALGHDDAANARRGNRDTDFEQLKASLAAHGVVQSLRVRPGEAKGAFVVVAGNRRLAALKELANEDVIASDYAVPVIIAKDGDAAAREISLVENVQRVPLTPIDEFRAYAGLVDDGATAGEVAARFGVPERRVQQRLRLAALHVDVLDALEAGEIGIEAAQAFTVQPDPERQAAYLAENRDRDWMLSASHIRRAMTDCHVRADSKLAEMLTEAAYTEAGGEILSDLFGDNRFWTSRDVIDRLLADHWQGKVAEWLADGWAWAAPRAEYGDTVYSMRRVWPVAVEPTDADQARLDEIEAEIDAMDGSDDSWTDDDQARLDALEKEASEIEERYAIREWTAEQKAYSGVIYGDDGDVLFGYIDPDKAAPPASENAPSVEKPKAKASDDPDAISAALSLDLSLMLSVATRRQVEADPDMALSLLAATLRRSLAHDRSASHVTASVANGLQCRNEGEAFDALYRHYRDMTPKARAKALAALFASTVDVSDSFIAYNGAADARDDLLGIVQPDPTPDFDAERYFAGINKAQIVAAYREMTGGGLNDGKKATMAEAAAAKAVETGWLPVQLRTASYQGPGADKLDEAA